jgi:hypothetical protein
LAFADGLFADLSAFSSCFLVFLLTRRSSVKNHCP